jgi:4-diphosphocytidyl-2-C-methyl-D-erythritol kinase
MQLREFAPAKVNLSLHVGRPRADGRHPLESIVVFADIGDVVWAEPAERPSLGLAGEFAGSLVNERDNLVVRAAQALSHAFNLKKGVKLTLEKRLPVASGIGGGSADAAATLRLLNRLWDLKLQQVDLQRIGAALGADVPACVAGRSCYMQGAGEETTPLAMPTLHAVLVNPLTAVSTRDVYAAFDARGEGAAFERAPAPLWSDLPMALDGLSRMRNDLAPAAQSLAPVIGEVIALLEAAPQARLVRLSGSGASVFALTNDADAAHALANDVMRTHPHWWTRAVRLAGI